MSRHTPPHSPEWAPLDDADRARVRREMASAELTSWGRGTCEPEPSRAEAEAER